MDSDVLASGARETGASSARGSAQGRRPSGSVPGKTLERMRGLGGDHAPVAAQRRPQLTPGQPKEPERSGTSMARNIISERIRGMPREYAADKDMPVQPGQEGSLAS